MTVDLAILILMVFVILYLSIIEVFTVLFVLTGLSETKARFQVISMLTNSGFTTVESEIITSSRPRRKLAVVTMLFGYTFTVLIVSMLINLVISMPTSGAKDAMRSVAYLSVFTVAIITIRKIPFVKVRFDKIIRNIGSKIMFRKNSNTFLVLDNYGDNMLAEMILVDVPEFLQEQTLAQSGLRNKYGIHILAIKRSQGTLSEITGGEILQKDDRVVLFGDMEKIKEAFNQRPSF